jgi:hypothetical protein
MEKRLAKEFAGRPIAIVAIVQGGNPAVRVVFVEGSARPGDGDTVTPRPAP